MEADTTGSERWRRMAETHEQPTGELTTSGTVIAHRTRSSGGHNRLLYPVVRFETQEGRTLEFESKTGSNIPPQVGEEVTVIYNPLRPEEARITLGSTIRFRPEAFKIVGLLVLGVFGLFFLGILMLILLVFLL